MRVNLLSQSQGARILFATDEWFAAAGNLLNDTPPIFESDTYCEQGKVMDGWETRRKRTPGHDWCLISLARRSAGKNLISLEIDTAHFTGNHVPRIGVAVTSDLPKEKLIPRGGGGQGTCATAEEVESAEAICSEVEWVDLIPQRTPLQPGYEKSRYHTYQISLTSDQCKKVGKATHLRVNYYPDGGVARMKLWADLLHDVDDRGTQSSKHLFPDCIDLLHGGKGLDCSNQHYGVPSNLIQPHRGKDMGDGWETARHPNRPPVLKLLRCSDGLCDLEGLMDWCILALKNDDDLGGIVQHIVIDTAHFKGNFPESVQVEGTFRPNNDSDVCLPPGKDQAIGWFVLLPRTKLGPDQEHAFELKTQVKPVSHVRITIWPDGGLSRVRLYGKKNKKRSLND